MDLTFNLIDCKARKDLKDFLFQKGSGNNSAHSAGTEMIKTNTRFIRQSWFSLIFIITGGIMLTILFIWQRKPCGCCVGSLPSPIPSDSSLKSSKEVSFDGKWTKNEEFTAPHCKGMSQCCGNATNIRRLRYVFKNPRLNIPRHILVQRFFHTIGNKNLTFIGDSTIRKLFQGIMEFLPGNYRYRQHIPKLVMKNGSSMPSCRTSPAIYTAKHPRKGMPLYI